MNKLRLHNIDDFFEMEVAVEEDHMLPSHGDAYITIKIKSHGFSGHNDLWVTGDEFASFCRSLVALEKELNGEAVLKSISPNELRLCIRSVSSRGHLAVEGETGYQIQGRNGYYWHSVSFGIEVEPSQLSEAVKLPWVQRYAG